MNNCHISIPESESMGLNYEESFRVIRIFLKGYSIHLSQLNPSESIDDIEAYPLQVTKRIVKMASTLNAVIERDHDYVVANIIIRSLADSIASFNLVYMESNKELKTLRHNLFIMDGFAQRLEQLSKEKIIPGRLKQIEFDALENQIKSAKSNYEEMIKHSTDCIKTLKLYIGYRYSIDNLIKNRNWKFKSLSSSILKNNSYNWGDLYEKLDFEISSYFSVQSEFVHGLSTSNMSFENEVGTYEPLYGISTALLGKLIEFLNCLYNSDIEQIKPKMISDILDKDMPDKYIAYILKSLQKQ